MQNAFNVRISWLTLEKDFWIISKKFNTKQINELKIFDGIIFILKDSNIIWRRP